MRSSKSRSRNKNNRNRNPLGNVVNRVFDSSGPEGKVRGTPQQIIDKYNQLARDAALSNDRVAAENFQQHAEHYLRLLSEAQKEQDARREQQERENRERQAQRDRERAERDQQESEVKAEKAQPVPSNAEVVDFGEDADSGLVETPESRSDTAPTAEPSQGAGTDAETADETPKKATRSRKPRKKPEPKPEQQKAEEPDAESTAQSEAPDAAE